MNDSFLQAGPEYKKCVRCCKFSDCAKAFRIGEFRVWGCIDCTLIATLRTPSPPTNAQMFFKKPILPLPVEVLFYE